MISASGLFRLVIALPLATTVACDQQPDPLTAPVNERSFVPWQPQLDVSTTVVHVANVEQLYAAVNDPGNAGAAITLAPGMYVLSATNAAGVGRPNAGRLELQRDMSLYGVTGDRSAVVIDATALPASSMAVPAPLTRTGPVRIGRGSNAIEWLTVLADPSAAGGIATELPGTLPTRIRVAHVISGGSSRGVDMRSVGAANAGRRVDAEIVDNEFFGPPPALIIGMSEGIRLANFGGADGGVIVATLTGNRVHGFQIGCIVANNRSSNAVVRARSSGDRFFANALGCLIMGAVNGATTGVANSNSTSFEAHGSHFVDNATAIGDVDPGGITVVGGRSLLQPNVTSGNTVLVSLWGTTVARNGGVNFDAYGARRDAPGAGIAGTNNHVTIELHGVSKRLDVVAIPSLPPEPAGTNTVTVIR